MTSSNTTTSADEVSAFVREIIADVVKGVALVKAEDTQAKRDRIAREMEQAMKEGTAAREAWEECNSRKIRAATEVAFFLSSIRQDEGPEFTIRKGSHLNMLLDRHDAVTAEANAAWRVFADANARLLKLHAEERELA